MVVERPNSISRGVSENDFSSSLPAIRQSSSRKTRDVSWKTSDPCALNSSAFMTTLDDSTPDNSTGSLLLPGITGAASLSKDEKLDTEAQGAHYRFHFKK
eukprot:6410275-Pyramimonas_sp.AAC.1